MGSGGGTGTIELPKHISGIHQDWFNYYNGTPQTRMVAYKDILDQATTEFGNPYDKRWASVYDPSAELTSVNSQLSLYLNKISENQAPGLFANVLNNAKTELETRKYDAVNFATLSADSLTRQKAVITEIIAAALAAVPTELIEDELAVFTARQTETKTKAKIAIAQSVGSVGAFDTSFYQLAIANIEQEASKQLAERDLEISKAYYDKAYAGLVELLKQDYATRIEIGFKDYMFKTQNMVQAAQLISNLYLSDKEIYSKAVQMSAEVNRIIAIAKTEQMSGEVDLNVKFASWDMQAYQVAANILAAPTGAASTIPQGPSKAASALGGAFSGAALGAQASGGNPWAVGAGAILGGLGGLLQ